MNIHELHDKLYDVLCVIDDICRQENIRYFLDGGTAIGAVREKDFIPWDDDMDIKVLAEDYPAFKQAMEKYLPEHMHLLEPDSFAPHFYDFTVRIYDDRWLIRKETPEDAFYGDMQNRVGTDVFIYFPAPASPLAQRWMQLRYKIVYGMAMAHRFTVKDEKYSFLQKLQVTVLRCMGRLCTFRQIYGMWEKIMWKERGDTGYFFTGNYPLAWLYFFPSDGYHSAVMGQIRSRQFPLPSCVDRELSTIYGDYMKPPEDKGIYIQHLDAEDMV